MAPRHPNAAILNSRNVYAIKSKVASADKLYLGRRLSLDEMGIIYRSVGHTQRGRHRTIHA